MKISPEAMAIARDQLSSSYQETRVLAAELLRLDRELTNAAIRERVMAINQRHNDALKKYQSEKEAIDVAFGEIMDACPHHETTHHGDASGNNDSVTVCEVCGKTWWTHAPT